jgi:hypothetical protein
MPPKRDLRRARVERDIINGAELRANAQQVLTTVQQERPENTHQVYDLKQKEFKVLLAS